MNFLKYIIDFRNFSTKAMGFEAHHYGVRLFYIFSLGVNYMPLQHATRLTFYFRLFNRLEFEWAIVIWEALEMNQEMVEMYDA